MTVLSLSDWSAIAQIVATLVTAVGVIASILLAIKTLRDVDNDRRLRFKPYLAFEPGGHRLRIGFVAGGGFIPGINRASANKLLEHLPHDGKSVVLVPGDGEDKHTHCLYGRLRNYGAGAAIDTVVTWVPTEMWLGNERFAIGAEKREEVLYSAGLNRMPAVPRHILPSESSSLTRIPAFIIKDYDRKISRVDGHFLIECKDIFGVAHTAKQDFHFFTDYDDAPPCVHVTFSNRDMTGA